MALARVVLALSSVAFAIIGGAFLLTPERMAPLVGLAFSGPLADNDLRAVYGGLQLGCAGFLAVCAVHSEWIRVGLVAQLLLFGGLLAGRFLSWLSVGLPPALGLMLHGAELVGFACGWLALSRLPRASPAP